MESGKSTTGLVRVVWLFGLPVSRVTEDEALEVVLRAGRERGKGCGFVATSNVDFLVKALTWWPGGLRHPELVDVLRRAELNTADGMPLVWAARWLGGELPARVSGSDIVPRLAGLATEAGVSVFLLGGSEEVARKAAGTLKSANAGLEVAGVDCPFVYTEGGRIVSEGVRDAAICERINASGAGILLIGFGNPKQEMWFQRNAYRLSPGVALGVGGTFNFVAGQISRAPAWMRRSGLEWVFRFYEEPGRLWKRYAVGLAKFAAIAGPVLAVHSLLGLPRGRRRAGCLLPVFYAGARSVRVVVLPSRLDREAVGGLEDVLNPPDGAEGLVIDASECTFVDASGLGLLWEALRDTPRACYLFCPHGRFRLLSWLHRAWDVFEPVVCRNAATLAARLEERFPGAGCFAAIESNEEEASVWFLGGLTSSELVAIDRVSLAGALGMGSKAIVVGLSYCVRLDGDGLALLVQLSQFARERGLKFQIRGVSPALAGAIRVAGLEVELLGGGAASAIGRN